MKAFSVKAYAELVGKSEKTVYKMIKNGSVDAFKYDGKYLINVDTNLLKALTRTQEALEEANAVLKSFEAESLNLQTAELSHPQTMMMVR